MDPHFNLKERGVVFLKVPAVTRHVDDLAGGVQEDGPCLSKFNGHVPQGIELADGFHVAMDFDPVGLNGVADGQRVIAGGDPAVERSGREVQGELWSIQFPRGLQHIGIANGINVLLKRQNIVILHQGKAVFQGIGAIGLVIQAKGADFLKIVGGEKD